MKKHIRALLFVAGLAATASSCSDDEPQLGSIDDLSQEAKSFLSMRSGSSMALTDGRSAAINSSFQGLFSNGGKIGGRRADGGTEPDTTIIEPDVPNCADVKYSEIPGGYITSVDYGEGCDLSWDGFLYVVFGKYNQKYVWSLKNNGSKMESEYEMDSEYENYGGRYQSDSTGEHSWRMSGTSNYSGESVWDSLNSKFSGSYSASTDMTYQYDDQEYTYFSEGSAQYDEKGSTQKTNTNRYTQGSDFYESVVLTPLVYKYSCNSFDRFCGNGISASYVSGREKITYKQGDKSGSFIINYGNGECDNTITIIENGVEIKIDLTNEWAKLAGG